MGPREEDNDMLLLMCVSLICATPITFLEFGSTKPAVAAKPAVLVSEVPVRVILPFKPTPRRAGASSDGSRVANSCHCGAALSGFRPLPLISPSSSAGL
jgi:hypothetical protein